MSLTDMQTWLWSGIAFLLLAGITIGVIRGFYKGVIVVIVCIAALVLTFISLTPLADFIQDNFITLDERFVPLITFSSLLFLSLLLFYLSSLPLQKLMPARQQRSVINKASGVLPGVIIGGLLVYVSTLILGMTPDVIMKERLLHANPLVETFYRSSLAVADNNNVNALAVVDGKFSKNYFVRRSDYEAQLLAYVQYERQKRNLQPFTIDNELAEAGRLHVIDMYQRNYFAHNTPEGITPFDRLKKLSIDYLFAGENLARGPGVEAAHDGLMKSPGHRANLLNPNFNRIGIAVIKAADGTLIIAQEFKD